MKLRLLVSFGLVASVLVLVRPAMAAGVSLPVEKTASANYYAAGQTVEVKGTVASDVLVAGGNVTVTGNVGGDVLVVGGNVRISGPVTGNVRILGGQVELAGSVGHNVSVAGGSVVLTGTSHVLGHVTAAAGSLDLAGVVESSVTAAGGDVKISGNIKGPVDLWLGRDGSLEVMPSAVTEAEFSYHATKQATIAPGAKLAVAPLLKPFVPSSSGRASHSLSWLIALFGSLALGLVLAGVLPKKLLEVTAEALAHPWGSLGRGALWAIVAPLVMVVLAVTIIGLPLAGILLIVYFIGLLLTPALAGAAVGWWLRSRRRLTFMQTWSTLLTVLVGITVYRVLTFLPVLGGLVSLVGTLWAWGALIQVQRRTLATFR